MHTLFDPPVRCLGTKVRGEIYFCGLMGSWNSEYHIFVKASYWNDWCLA